MGSKAELRHGKAAPVSEKRTVFQKCPGCFKSACAAPACTKLRVALHQIEQNFYFVQLSIQVICGTSLRMAATVCGGCAVYVVCMVIGTGGTFFSARNSLHGPHAESEDLCGGVLFSHYTILPGGAQAPPGRILFNFFVCLFPLNPSCSAERP